MIPSPENTKHYWFKRFLPTSLFGRALLILVLPMLLMQAIVGFYFYAFHWGTVERHLSSSLVGDIVFLVHEMKESDEKHRHELELLAPALLGIEMREEPADPNVTHFPNKSSDPAFSSFAHHLDDALEEPFSFTHSARENREVILRIQMKNSVLRMQFSIKRLASVTTEIFLWWMLGSAVLLLLIATLFLRNQIRPIRKLAQAAEDFGKGLDNADFRPQGANEVRQAGRSFIAMRERIKRMLSARTEMLASISHDLRTPLTRMRLQLAMLPDQKQARPLTADVQDMEKMIQEYLDFARGEGGEQPRRIRLSALLNEVVAKYTQQGANVTLLFSCDLEVTIFPGAMRRCLYNVIDNALKYGSRCEIRVDETAKRLQMTLDDDGPGIPSEHRELAMQPFKRLDPSRNLDTGGAGLGLSIVQDIVLRHGGEIMLEDSPLGGLRVRIRLPL